MIPSSVRDRVSKQIEKKGVQPLPAWLFAIRNDLFWALVAGSIGIGGLVASLWILLMRQEEFDLYHLALIDTDAFIILVLLPCAWFLLLLLLSGITAFNLRHTKQGYRFGMVHVLIASIIGSLVLGMILHTSGWSDTFDLLIRQNVHSYRELRDRRMNLWTHPDEGMLAGTLEDMRADTLFVRDFNGVLWEIDIAGIPLPSPILMQLGMPLRILGYSLEGDIFVAESIRPWRPGGPR